MTQQIPLSTMLGDRYKVTAHILETASGDLVLDGLDQVLSRKVSIVVADPAHNRLLVANARKSPALSRSNVQVLDLGNTGDSTYLITSHARPDVLLDALLTDADTGTSEKFGEEIFGDTGPMSAPNTYVRAKDAGAAATGATAATAPISATRSIEPVPHDEYEEYDAEQDGYYEGEESPERNGGKWAIGIAAILLLVIAAGVAFTGLGAMVDSDASQEAFGRTTATPTATARASTTPTPSPTPTEEKKLPAPKLDGNFTRTVPSSPNLMAESDALLGTITDGNPETHWISLAFGSANFGGLTDSFYLAAKLDQATTVNSLTINQISGTGGAFKVFASSSASIDGAKEIGSGTFAAPGETTVELNKDAQDGNTEYIIVQFTSVPQLAQPIVGNFPFGLRLAEISVK
ncbi:serine/threonine protein kinase [Rothia nasimurium]|uniref:serine/threonine protein kinase n=1 Tax=Rothia nasimurium TaxID=85336 RepID=UPI001F194878|nr:serine/threonine protein kinase [Rothia nasimurium]